tara:strand:- start:53 stop:358 length:306 start_codon:yes stop_codon:yes gene_type:complete
MKLLNFNHPVIVGVSVSLIAAACLGSFKAYAQLIKIETDVPHLISDIVTVKAEIDALELRLISQTELFNQQLQKQNENINATHILSASNNKMLEVLINTIE